MTTLAKILRDQKGASALEFALTAPVFFLLIFGVIELGLMLWTQIGLQHGAEMAARCASINSTACPTSNPSAIANYATQQAYGVPVLASNFSYSTPPCGSQVNASYLFQFPEIMNMGPVTLIAQACFPS